jgi:methylmalonyl-CoA/ethylmalonyl-CoA epimerase
MEKIVDNLIRFHHIGIACVDMEKEINYYQIMGYEYDGIEYIDKNLGIKCRFLNGGGPRIELVVEYNSNVLQPYLKNNSKIYHMAFKTKKIFDTINNLKKYGYKIIIEPTPAIAFSNKSVCFLMSPTMSLIEIIEN